MLAAHIAHRTKTSANEIDRTRRFDHLGLDSADAVTLVGELEDFVGRPLSAALPYVSNDRAAGAPGGRRRRLTLPAARTECERGGDSR